LSRIPPLERPWPPFFAEAMERVMPEGAEPLLLFRTVAASQRAWTKFAAGSLLDKGPLPLREREIVIHRTAARCGCGYEWGIHAALFAERAGMDEDQLLATAAESIDYALWTEAETDLLETVDALIDRKRLTAEEFERLGRHFDTGQILEMLQLVAFYHGVALICGAIDLAPEPGTPNLPS
jgi:alkylhydroperoxidase family enzyme